MTKIILTLILVLFTTIGFATEIVATVVFDNLTDKKFTSGEFTIIDLNKKTEITKAENFKIILPEKGKYKFKFVSNDFIAYIFYPTKINKRKNIITIRLTEKPKFNNLGIYSFLMNLDTDLTNEQIEERVADGTSNFIMYGINASISKEYEEFKRRYGIGFVKQNCLIDPISFKKATENNQIIRDYLNKKYGNSWLKELSTKPFGIK